MLAYWNWRALMKSYSVLMELNWVSKIKLNNYFVPSSSLRQWGMCWHSMTRHVFDWQRKKYARVGRCVQLRANGKVENNTSPRTPTVFFFSTAIKFEALNLLNVLVACWITYLRWTRWWTVNALHTFQQQTRVVCRLFQPTTLRWKLKIILWSACSSCWRNRQFKIM